MKIRTNDQYLWLIFTLSFCFGACSSKREPDRLLEVVKPAGQIARVSDPILQSVAQKNSRGPSLFGTEPELVSFDELTHINKLADEGIPQAIQLHQELNKIVEDIRTQVLPFQSQNVPAFRQAFFAAPINQVNIDIIKQAKKLWIDLTNGPGAVLSLRSLSREASFVGIKNMMDIAAINAHEIDQSILKDILLSHQMNKRLLAKGGRVQTVVQGSGLVGLYAAIKLFESGAVIKLLNEPEEIYKMKQMIRLDPKWQVELQYFLGTGYDHLFITSGYGVFKSDGFAEIPLHEVEDQLKQVVVLLSDHVHSVENINADPDLCFFAQFTTQVVGLVLPGMVPAAGNPFQVAIRNRPVGQPLGPIEHEPAELLVLAGGGINSLVDRLISPAYSRTETKLYSASVLNKKLAILKVNVLKNKLDFNERLKNSDIARNFSVLGYDGFIRDFINSQKANLSDEVFDRYSTVNMSDLIRNETEESYIDVGQFENDHSVYLVYKVPKAIMDLRIEIENSKPGTGIVVMTAFDQFLKGLETRWHEVGKILLVEPVRSGSLVPDPQPMSQGTFAVGISKGDKTVKVYQDSLGIKLIAAAVGDTLAIPQLMSLDGLNTGRESVDDLSTALKAYNTNSDDSAFVALNESNKRIQKNAIERHQSSVFRFKSIEPKDQQAIAKNKMIAVLKHLTILWGAGTPSDRQLMSGIHVSHRDPDHLDRFMMGYEDGYGIVEYPLQVNSDGSLSLENNLDTKYNHYLDAYLALTGGSSQ